MESAIAEKTIEYPYNPGKAGIPFEQIFQNFRNGTHEGVITGGSGRKLAYDVRPDYLYINDPELIGNSMSAKFDSGIASFGLYTKVPDSDRQSEFPSAKHPDMFAKLFIDVALKHFKEMGNDVRICRAEWLPDSDNFKAYNEALRLGLDPVEAAKGTWSGKAFMEHGFTQVPLKGIVNLPIKTEGISDEISIIKVDFHRPI